ncbi:MAG: EI24 domain-containing protein [Phaeovulum sp.]|uniref:EI24 domain-containing protein n=1 Tax=Phaeovulum sp. TaxID=2934796 RepID=UPI002732B483|nr:EI24 domain-containing protein [Phaeovulum sp.]MDP3860161.1 EI24 domain-containing protein [Phaeovulum sp.]
MARLLMLGDFVSALGDLFRARALGVLALGVALSLALLVLVYAGFVQLIDWTTPDVLTLPWVGEVHWVRDLLSWGSLAFMLVASFFLMMPVASLFTGLFLETVAAGVEARHYPQLPPASGASFTQALQDSLNFLALLIGANIVALILYTVMGPAAPLLFWGLNGYLLGREYFQMVALRRLDRAAAKALRRKHWGEIWVAGVLMALPLTVPLVNLVVPVLAAASFTHLFHRLRGEPKGRAAPR